MDPSSIEQFLPFFRSAAPYIHAFGGRTFVIAFGGEVVEDGKFLELTHDLNLLASLEVRLVLVHGARPQIEKRLKARKAAIRYVHDMRVTDEAALQDVKEASGRLRMEIEALLSMGLPNSPMANATNRVASGNFVVAQPVGVVEGVDMQYTGEVRKVHADAIQSRLDAGEVVLLSSIGYSPTGEIFNLTLEDVASQVGIALKAEKVIFLMNESGVSDKQQKVIREMTVSEAKRAAAKPHKLSSDALIYLPFASRACEGGVKRAHLISRHQDGALLLELFTHNGVGTMITQDYLEHLRPATIEDVGGIIRLIGPLEEAGVLVKRSRELLEREIGRFFILEHDAVIVGCAALYPLAGAAAGELACLAIDPMHRGSGAGQRLLEAVEAAARKKRMKKLFVLTTRTAHWFIEQGFTETGVASLPKKRQEYYNLQRRSKVLTKAL